MNRKTLPHLPPLAADFNHPASRSDGAGAGRNPGRLTRFCLFAGMLVLLALPASATTRTVTNTSDNNAGSLRSTIANSLAGDAIDFNIPTSDSGYSATTGVFTITLTSGELGIGRNLTISGLAGIRITISGNDASRVFNILSGTTVGMSNLKISHGRVAGATGAYVYPNVIPGGDAQGGGIQNQGTLNLTNCILDSNSAAGGSEANDTYNYDATGGFGKGGGIVSSGALNLIDCTLSNNSATGGSVSSHRGNGGAGSGGAIWNSGTLTMAACTLNNNSANAGASIVLNFGTIGSAPAGAGGGVFNQGTQTLTNCTFSGNSVAGGRGDIQTSGGDANGGGSANQGSAMLTNCTFSGNSAVGGNGGNGDGYAGGNGGNAQGGGIYQSSTSGSTTARNTIVAGNTASGGSGGPGSNGQPNGTPGFARADVSGTISSQGHNLVGKTDGSSGWSGTDLTGTQAAPLNPQLGPLQNNGGPTYTFAPASGSAAVDNGDDSVTGAPSNLTTDQRGYPRKSGSHVDIGALEVISVATVANLNDAGAGSLRQALAEVISGGTVSFAAGLSGTITLTSGSLAFTKSVSVIGPGANKLTISANHAGAVVTFSSPGVSISGLTLANGGTGSYGVADLGNYIAGSPHSLSDCVITGNQGGGCRTSGTTQMTRCTIVNNSITGVGVTGGGIFCNGLLTLTNCTVANNMVNNTATFSSGSGGGGGIYSGTFGSLTVIATTVARNSLMTTLSSPNGGGISSSNAAKIRNSIIASNTVTRSGTVSASDASGTFTSNGYNLVGNTTGSTGFGATGDKLNLAANLGTLGFYGGALPTVPPLPGSPALDAGDDALLSAPVSLTTDERGAPRPRGSHVDIGAFEGTAPFADFNADGKPDYVLVNPSNGQVAAWYLNGGTYIGGAVFGTVPAGYQLIGVADMNGDGYSDLITFNPSTRAVLVLYFRGINYLGYGVGPTPPPDWALTKVADFNNDGQPDFLISNTVNRQANIWHLNGVAYASAVVAPTLPANLTLVRVADFNGDGRPDYVFFNPANRQTSVWYLNDGLYLGTGYGPVPPAGWALIGAGDFNADGMNDFVISNLSNKQTVIWLLNGVNYSGALGGPTLASGFNLAAP